MLTGHDEIKQQTNYQIYFHRHWDLEEKNTSNCLVNKSRITTAFDSRGISQYEFDFQKIIQVICNLYSSSKRSASLRDNFST